MSPTRASSPPESPTSPSPDPLEADLPGFQTHLEAADELLGGPSPSPSSQGLPWDGGTDELPDEPTSPSSRRDRRSPASTKPDAFVGVFEALLRLLTFFLHMRLAPKHQPNTLWLADQDDLDAIAPPLSRIAARHAPMDGGPVGDVGDVIEATIGAGGYGIKNMIAGREFDRDPVWDQQDDQAAAASPPPAPMSSPFPEPPL